MAPTFKETPKKNGGVKINEPGSNSSAKKDKQAVKPPVVTTTPKRFDNLKEIGLKESMDLLLWVGVVRLIQAAGQGNIARELYQPPPPYEVDQLEFPRPEHRVFPYDLSKAAEIFDELLAAKPAQSPVIQRLA